MIDIATKNEVVHHIGSDVDPKLYYDKLAMVLEHVPLVRAMQPHH